MKYILTLLLGLTMALTSQAQKKTYEYDDVQRLTKVNVWVGTSIAQSIVYTYDELGNRTSKVITTGSCQTATATLTAPTGTNLTATTANIQWNSTPINVNLRYRIVGTTMWNTANNLTSSQTWLTGLIPNTNYEAQVQTICSGGILSAFTASINFTTLNCSNMYTLKTGNWNDITVWSCGRVPTSTDIITVKASHSITIPATYTANAKNVIFETGGKIIEAANTSKLCLSCPQIPTNGLIGYYPLNGNANDASGNGLNGGIVGSITSITDRKGIANSAYQFSGVVLNYISIPDNALLCSNIITLNAWVNFAPSEGGYIINKGRDIQNGSYRLTSGSASGQVLYNGINDASYASVPTNQWVMVTGIINGNNAKYYVNGVMVSQATLSSSYVCSSAGNPLTFGNHYYNGIPDVWAYPYKGKIDDVRIYNRALSDAEVLQIYNGEK